jgi:hypothetical protein
MASSCLFGTIDSSYVFSTNVWISSARKKDFHRSPAQVLDVCGSVVAVALASCEKPVRRFGFSWISCRAQSPRGLSVRAAFTGMWDAVLPAHHVNGSPRGPCIRAGLQGTGSVGACGTWISSTLHVICSPCGLCARTGLESLRRLNACGTWMQPNHVLCKSRTGIYRRRALKAYGVASSLLV